MTVGPKITAARAGAIKRSCPISSERNQTNDSTMNTMAFAGRSAFPCPGPRCQSAMPFRSGVIAGPEVFLRNVAQSGATNPSQAKFNVRWCAAKMLIDGQLDISSFAEPTLSRPDIRELADRIDLRMQGTPGMIEDLSPAFPDSLTLHLTSGETLSDACGDAPGTAGNPMPPDRLVEKFYTCADYAGVSTGGPRLFLDADDATSLGNLMNRVFPEFGDWFRGKFPAT